MIIITVTCSTAFALVSQSFSATAELPVPGAASILLPVYYVRSDRAQILEVIGREVIPVVADL